MAAHQWMNQEAMMNGEYRRNGRVIVRRGLALSLGLWLALVVGALPRPALAAFNSTVASTISVFYAAALGRTPVPNSSLPDFGDLGGLAFWTDAFLAGEGDLAQYNINVNSEAIYAIAGYFAASPEFLARYPETLTPEEYVTALYNNLLGRDPDEEGLAFWVGELAGGASRGKVLADFTNSEEAQEFNPTQQAAMQIFIALLAANDGVVTPEQASVWVAENPTLEAAAVDSPGVPVVTLAAALVEAPVGPYQINANVPVEKGAVAVADAQAVYPQVVALLRGATNADSFTGEDAAVVFIWAIADTAANILAATDDPAVTGAASVGLTAAALVAEVGALEALANFDGVYALADTLENLAAAAEGVVAGATEYALTDQAGDLGILSAEQIALVKGANNTGSFTWQTQGPNSPTFTPPSSPNGIPPQPITITTTTPGATIRFATVDNDVDNESNQLTCKKTDPKGTLLENEGKVMVNRSLTLHAIACLNEQESVPATAPYQITNPVTFNDTGIDQCAENDRYGEIPCPIVRFPGQDADYGRDAWARGDFAGASPDPTGLAKIGGGAVGFDFTRICGDGREEGKNGCLENFVFNSNNPSLRTGDGPDDWACTRDNVTGLIWEIKTDAIDIPSRGLRDKNWTYTWYNPNSATNGGNPGVRTGGICRLSGTQQPSCDTQGYLAAINAINGNEGGLCGRKKEKDKDKDWRLPTSNELNQLMHYGRIQPSMDEGYFPTIMPGVNWTSETLAADSSLAWIVASSNGAVEPTSKGNPFGRILAVSGSRQVAGNSNHCQNGFSSTLSGQFMNHGNGTVTHQTTQLMWARCALGRMWNGGSCTGPAKQYNWENALQEVKGLNDSGRYANYRDWRVPNIKELNSIVEHCRTNPAINTTVFPDMSPTMTDFWSSSPLITVQSSAWYLDFRFGRVDWTGKSNTYQVLLVRDAAN